jgi:hypothetical protein
VRYSILVSDPSTLALALDLAEYGRRLWPRLQFEGAPPFERTFDDYAIFLRAILDQDRDAGLAHFRRKEEAASTEELEASLPVQVFVTLLSRVGRVDEAIEVFARRLAHLPEQALTCPGLAELCHRAGRIDRLRELSRQQGNLVTFLAAKLQGS